MKIPYELRIGWRYTRVGKQSTGDGFVSFIAMFSMIGIALGVASLIIVLSVMNGFQRDVRDRMLSVFSHVEIFSVFGQKAGLKNWTDELTKALQDSEVMAGAPYFDAQGLLSYRDSMHGMMLRGVDPGLEPKVSMLGAEVIEKSLANLLPGCFRIVIAGVLADNLGISIGDKVTIVAPQGIVSPAGMLPRFKQFKVIGVFRSGHFEFDSGLAFLNIEDAQALYRQDAPTGVRLKVRDIHRAPYVVHRLRGILSEYVGVRDWTQQNKNWFAAVQVEKRMMFIILTLIIAVAAFNLVSLLVMTVRDKQADIAVLRTLGARSKSIMLIFFFQGIAIGTIGIIIGLLIGILTAINIPIIIPAFERLFNVHFLPPGIYFINELPSQVLWQDVTKVIGMAFFFCSLATLYPSWRAARVEPAKALRYE